MLRQWPRWFVVLIILTLVVPTLATAAPPVSAQAAPVDPQDVTLRPSDLPPGFSVTKQATEPFSGGGGIVHTVALEREATAQAVASGPIFVMQVVGRFDRPTSYEGFLDELRQKSIENDGYELVPGAPNDGGTASLQKFEGEVAAFQVGFIKRDMVIFTGWVGRKGVVSLQGVLTLAGVSSARYDEVLAARSAPPPAQTDAASPAASPAAPPPSSPEAAAAPPASPPTQRGHIANTGGTGANVRSHPEVSGELLVVVHDGNNVELIGVEEHGADGRKWRNIRTAGGVTGWVVAEYVAVGAPPSAAAAAPPPAAAAPPVAPSPAPQARPRPAPAAPPPPPQRTTASGHPIAGTYVFTKVAAPQNDHQFICLTANPSCSRDPWWVVWSEIQSDTPVQFSFLPPGLVAEERFIEAIWLLWQWDEGKQLLKAAAEQGVTIAAIERSEDALGFYNAYFQVIGFNPRFVETSTWMVASVLAHELKHVADHKAGRIPARSSAECFAVERAAYGVEYRYLAWMFKRFGGLPSPSAVAGQLSQADFELYMNLYMIGNSSDLDAAVQRDYRKTCLR